MHRALAPFTARRARHLAHFDVLTGGSTADAETVPAALFAEVREAEDAREKCRRRLELSFPHPYGVQPSDLSIVRHRRPVPRREVRALCRLDERELLAMRIDERQDAFTAT